MYSFRSDVKMLRNDLKEFTKAMNHILSSDKVIEHRIMELEINRKSAKERFVMLLDKITAIEKEIIQLKNSTITHEQISDLKEFYESRLKYLDKQ